MGDALARYRANYEVTATVKAFKRLQELGEKIPEVAQDELELELTVLDFLEQACYAFLTSLGVEPLEQQYLIGYEKRLWVYALRFSGLTYEQNRGLLTNEYIARGHTFLEDPDLAAGLWTIVDDAKTMKLNRAPLMLGVFVGLMV